MADVLYVGGLYCIQYLLLYLDPSDIFDVKLGGSTKYTEKYGRNVITQDVTVGSGTECTNATIYFKTSPVSRIESPEHDS